VEAEAVPQEVAMVTCGSTGRGTAGASGAEIPVACVDSERGGTGGCGGLGGGATA